jgi:hypothetical protein
MNQRRADRVFLIFKRRIMEIEQLETTDLGEV